MNKFYLIVTVVFSLASTACATATHDLAKTLRYADGKRVGVKNVDLKALQTSKKGQACTWNFLFFLPILGDGSILSAANEGNINNVKFIGETGSWYFPFNKNCTIVYGDTAPLILPSSLAPSPGPKLQPDRSRANKLETQTQSPSQATKNPNEFWE